MHTRLLIYLLVRYVNEQQHPAALATMKGYIRAHPALSELHEEATDQPPPPSAEVRNHPSDRIVRCMESDVRSGNSLG